jgi:hypothetical protein
MFKITYHDLIDVKGVNIGLEVRLEGELRYGISETQIEELEQVKRKILGRIMSDVIVINVLNLKRWDSLGINSLLAPFATKINEDLISKGRIPVSIVGDRKSDVFNAAKDKFIENGTDILPWFDSLETFVKSF